jgi:CRISPR-associated protein Cas1
MDKQLLPITKDRISILYIDKAEIKQKEFSVIMIKDTKEFDIPIANIQCIILGPGTSITHNAIKQIADYGCSLI